MSFRKNDCQQLSFVDSFWGLTEREKKVLQNSWAGIFADEIFPSLKAKKRAEYVRNMNTEKFKLFAKLRNGVETIPSIFRKNFRLDKLPKGIIRGKFFFDSKVIALNFRKLFGFRKGLGKCAPSALLA